MGGLRELTVVKYQRRRKPPGPTARATAKKRRAERPVVTRVRALCVERDGYCRYWKDVFEAAFVAVECDGPSEWAHLENMRRSKTQRMKPELRHTTAGTAMLCRKHHDRLDGRARPRLRLTVLTNRGADGPLQWRTSR